MHPRSTRPEASKRGRRGSTRRFPQLQLSARAFSLCLTDRRDATSARHAADAQKIHYAAREFRPAFRLPSDRGRKEVPKRVAIGRMEEFHRLLRLGLPIDRTRMTER